MIKTSSLLCIQLDTAFSKANIRFKILSLTVEVEKTGILLHCDNFLM